MRLARARSFVGLVGLLCAIAFASLRPWSSGQTHVAPAAPAAYEAGAGEISSATFEANRGQTDARVEYLGRGNGYTLFFTSNEVVLNLCGGVDHAAARPAPADSQSDVSAAAGEAGAISARCSVVRMRLAGSNDSPKIEALDLLPGRSNYLIGTDPGAWLTDVPHFRQIRYSDVYQDVDLVFYGRDGLHEYDLILAPGVDPSIIRMDISGPEGPWIDAEGNLVVPTPGGVFLQHPPVIYQETAGSRQEVRGTYEIRPDGRVGFAIADYDHSHSLIIDPVLEYSTFLGGSALDTGYGIAVDGAGQAYVAGHTRSANFPTAESYQGSPSGSSDAFVTKYSATGEVIFSTYVGGGGTDEAREVAVDTAGSIYITGSTNSTDFPTSNAAQPTYGGGTQDAFIVKLNSLGSAPVYSTYLGGSNYDLGEGIAVDIAGRAYVVGDTLSTDFPTLTPLYGSYSGFKDAFITKLPITGSSWFYSSYLGGTILDEAENVAVDSSGNVYITGKTQSTNFPTKNAVQPSMAGGLQDGYLTKINYAGSALDYSTYIGGSDDDIGNSVFVDAARNAYVAGRTRSSDFPTLNALQPSYVGVDNDAFVAKHAGDGSAVYATYLGGSATDSGLGIAADERGYVFLLGETQSTDFPTQEAIQPIHVGFEDLFVARIDPTGRRLVYSTYLGGAAGDLPHDLAIDNESSVFITGMTVSAGSFPTAAAAQPVHGGMGDAFVAKVSASLDFFIAAVEADPTSRSVNAAPEMTDPNR